MRSEKLRIMLTQHLPVQWNKKFLGYGKTEDGLVGGFL